MKRNVPPAGRRRLLLGSIIVAPAILAAVGVSAVETWRLLQPRSELFTAPFAYSLADAIERNDVEQAHAFIRDGQDPNQPIAVRHPVLTGGRTALVSPIVWAVATQRREALLMLMGYGARTASATDVNAVCLADALGNTDMVRLLVTHGSPAPDERCGNLRLEDVPLLGLPHGTGSAGPTAERPSL